MGQTLVLAGQTITPAVLNRIYATADTTSHIVNTSTYGNLSTVYSIPAGDALAGTAYSLECFGNGTWGSTAQSLTLSVILASTNIGTAPAINSTVFSTSAAFDFYAKIRIICVGPGSSATWFANIDGKANQTANNIVPGTAADNSVAFTGCTHSAVTQDSTVSNNFAIQAKWASTTGSPTLTCLGTIFTKLN